MGARVPEEVLQDTKKCDQNFACLKTGACQCEVEYVVGERVLFLEDRQAVECPYRKTFGDRQICRCPTHYAIHAARIQQTANRGGLPGRVQRCIRRMLQP